MSHSDGKWLTNIVDGKTYFSISFFKKFAEKGL